MSLDYRPALGDLVVVHDPRLAQQLGKQEALGVVVRLRRNGARALFLPRGDAYWFESHRLHPHPDPERIGPPTLLALGEALRVLRPEEAELAGPAPVEHSVPASPDDVPPTLRVEVLCRELTAAAAATLQHRLGARLVSWEVRPYGMALVTVALVLGAGTAAPRGASGA